MIRSSTHNGRDYVTVITTLKVESDTTVVTPMHIHVDISKLSDTERLVVFNKVDKLFNHQLILKTTPPKSANKKPWYKRFGFK